MIRLKKEIVFIVCLIISLFILCFFTSCGENSDHIQSVVTDTTTADTKPEVIKYKVTFDSNGANEIDPQFVEINKRVNEPEIPTRLGYTFDGWYAGSEKWIFLSHIVDNDITLTAKWKPNNNAIIFDANGGIGIMDGMSIATDSSQNLIPNRFTKAGYSFIGWATSEFGSVEYIDGEHYKMGAEESYTLYAKWQANENTIVFDTNGGIGTMDNISVSTDSTVDLPPNTYERAGYTFEGWSTNKNGAVEYTDCANYVMGKNSIYTLYAIWRAKENTLVFDANGGIGTMPNMTIATDDSVNLTSNAFTKYGYTFAGWATSADGTVEYTDMMRYTMGVNSSYTLYAIWQAKDNTILFNANGGNGTMASMKIATCESDNLVKNTFTKKGYDFMGWSTTPNGNVEYTDQAIYTMGTNNSYTLYAVWEIIKYTITYENNGGQGGSNPTIFTIEDLPLEIKDLNNKTNFLFNYWYKERDFSGTPITEITTIGNVNLYAEYIEGTDGLIFTEYDGNWKISGYEGNSTSIVIPNTYKGISISEIEHGAFFGCSNLESITVPFVGGIKGEATGYGTPLFGYIFGNSYYDGAIGTKQYYSDNNYVTYYIPATLKSVTITGGTNIKGGAFSNCSNLEKVTINTGITKIEDRLFKGCESLRSVTIPDSVTSIGQSAFFGCTSLTTMIIPNNVKSIKAHAFSSCNSLTIYCEATDKPSDWDEDWNYTNCSVVWGYTKNQ